MNRRFLLSILLVMLIASATAPFIFTAQASSGCNAVSGLSGFYSEKQSKSTGSITFAGGETITVQVTEPSPSGFTDVQLVVGGFNQISTGAISYKIPSDGNYTVTVKAAALEDLKYVSVSCGGSGAPWGGFTDGRLNPDMAENYSLWCLRNNLDIYRSRNGVGELIISVPLSEIFAVSVGKSLNVTTKTGPIVIERFSTDVVFVKGNNGTNGPSYTEKFFSVQECITRNGGSKIIPTRIPLPTSTPQPTVIATSVSSDGTGVGNLVSVLLGLGPTDPASDTDGDGTRNSLDLCPTISAPGLAFGCPDDDGDGTSNPVDQCPTLQGSIYGCPDPDGDGVSARNDLCPNFVPPADKPSVFGCLDSDGDGFPNGHFPGTTKPMDWCPLQAGDPGGNLFMGCPDPDGDGFLDKGFRLVPPWYYDDCPNYPYPLSSPDDVCPGNSSVSSDPPDPIASLFLYAHQVGAYDNLYVPTQAEQTQICSSASYTFCGL